MIRALGRYFRQHRWQRRLLTGSLAAIIGGVLGLLFYPRIRDGWLIDDLGSEDKQTRLVAITEIRTLVRNSPDTLDRLVEALETDSDRRFFTVVAVLKSLARESADMRDRLSGEPLERINAALQSESDRRFSGTVSLLQLIGRFDVPGRRPEHVDRLDAISMADAQADAKKRADPEYINIRWMILAEVLATGRDNRHVRRISALGCVDASSDVRALASILAARLADDEALAALLADKDPGAVSAAALSAAAGGREGLVGALRPLLTGGGDDEVVSAAAYALARLDAEASGPGICGLLLQADTSQPLRDRLLHVMTVLNSDVARKAVSSVLAAARRAKRYPPALALLAAGKLKMADADQDIRAVLTDNRANGKLDSGHLQAAIRAAGLLDLPVREELFLLCRSLWGRFEPLTAISAMRELGRQAAKDQPHEKSTRAQCISLLRLAADTAHGRWPWPGRENPVTVRPVPGAAAAVALWLLDAEQCGHRIRQATHHKDAKSLSGDYVAWHVGLDGPPGAAVKLALQMLPPLRGGVYNDEERAAGAMLLALSPRTDRQRTAAIERISVRLKHEDDAMIAGAFRCALLMLGRKGQFTAARALRGILSFPRRRVMTALLAVGDKDTIDWLLLNRQVPLDDVAELLTNVGIGEVIAAAAPALGRVDPAGDGRMQKWQARIMRHHWGVQRAKIAVGLRR